MKVLCFSSFTFAYLNRARVLFQSLRRFHPNWTLVALITDEPPADFPFSAEDEPFDVVLYAQSLGIENFNSWLFQHDVVEACTAVKGPFSVFALSNFDADAVVYLDPDTCLFGSLDPIERLLHDYAVILTPHMLEAESDRQAIIDNEICSLKTGIYNLGFCAFRTTGHGAGFARWWSDRLTSFCVDDIPEGLFVDQRWCDHVPALFDKVKILRDPGYNVASWNIAHRHVEIGIDGAITAGGAPLRFWHFTKLGPTGDTMTRRYAADNFPVYEIWNWYKREISKVTDARIPPRYWAYDTFDNGVAIDRVWRRMYRSDEGLRQLFPEPFASGPKTYYDWLSESGYLAS